MLNLSYSSTADARSCWKRFYYKDIVGYIPKKRESSLGVGTVIHECFDLHFNKASLQDVLTHIENSYNKIISEELNPNEVERFTIDKSVCMGMWMSYPFSDMGFQEVLPEKKFEVKLGNMHGVKLVGRIDGLIKKDDKWWIREVKTTSLSQQQFQGRAAVSYQASGYIYGIEKQEKIKVHGVLYDTIKRPLLRKRVTESASEFADRIVADYANPKNKDFYYDRYYSYRSDKEMEEFEIDMIKLAREIRTRKRKDDWYRNTDACWTFGKECPYKRICWVDKPNDDMIDAYYERRKNHEQLYSSGLRNVEASAGATE